MNPNDVDMVEVVDHTADRPQFSDGGDSVVVSPAVEPPAKPKPKKPRRKPMRDPDLMSEEELMAEAGVEPIFSTSEAAEFFDRSNQWLYWGLRENVFTHADGSPIDPERIGDPVKGRRRFTLPIIKEIMKSSYRRGNLGSEQLKTIMRRIRYAEMGVEWREREGWKYAHLGRNRHRWVKANDAVWNAKLQEWNLRPGVKVPRDD